MDKKLEKRITKLEKLLAERDISAEFVREDTRLRRLISDQLVDVIVTMEELEKLYRKNGETSRLKDLTRHIKDLTSLQDIFHVSWW